MNVIKILKEVAEEQKQQLQNVIIPKFNKPRNVWLIDKEDNKVVEGYFEGWININGSYQIYTLSSWSYWDPKDIFATKEEAENALAEMKR